MGRLGQAEWDALAPEEQEARQDEKPEAAGSKSQDEGGDDKVTQLVDQVKDLSAQLKQLQFESSGKERDLREERRLRQELEGKLGQLQDASDHLGLKDLKDEDYVSAAQLKKVMTGVLSVLKTQRQHDGEARADERMADDEERMRGRLGADKDAVSYDEAIDEFKALAAKDPSLWDDVNREARRQGGRPAEKAYKIALRESPKYRGLERKRGREEVIRQIDEGGKVPSLKGSGGGGKGPKDLSKLTDEEIAKMSDAELDAALAQV